MSATDDAIFEYARQHSSPEDKVLAELNRETHLRTVYPNMLSGHLQGRFLEMISRLLAPHRILEIGTFTGYSAICMARGLAEGGLLHTIDINDIIYFPVSEASGYSSRLINANKYKREGWEVILNATPVQNPNSFTWDVSFNWSRHRRYLLELPEGVTELNGVKIGERMDLYRGWVFNKSSDGKIIYEGGLPTWDPYIKKLGYQDPDWTWGISNSFRYKFIKLNILIDGRYKGLIWSQTIRKMYWGGTHPETVSPYRDDQIAGKATYVGEGVTVTGGEVIYDAQGNIVTDTRTYEDNTTPVFWSDWCQYYYHDVSDEAVTFDASFIKLREITLTLDLPKKWVSKARMEKASVSFIGRNIWMWSYIKYIDPDTGYDNLQTPSSRNLGFNINITF